MKLPISYGKTCVFVSDPEHLKVYCIVILENRALSSIRGRSEAGITPPNKTQFIAKYHQTFAICNAFSETPFPAMLP